MLKYNKNTFKMGERGIPLKGGDKGSPAKIQTVSRFENYAAQKQHQNWQKLKEDTIDVDELDDLDYLAALAARYKIS